MERRGITFRRIIRDYVLQIIIYVATVSATMLTGYYFLSQRTWFEEDRWYPLLHWIHNNWQTTLFICILVGIVVISSFHIGFLARMLERVAAAMGMLNEDRDSYINLPEQLHEMEVQINQMLQNARQDRQAAKEAEQRKNDLIVYMAHDLKTPLTSVLGYLTLLRDEREISAQIKDRYLGIALHKAERLEELINEFFEITRFNFTRMLLELSEINFSRMTEQIVYEFRPLFEEKRLTCRTEISPQLSLSCDADKLERVFDNLLKNAINYSYEGTEILVALQQEDTGGVRLTVQNHGKTIPEERLEHIFEQFVRIDSSRATRTGGSGLGLAIAKEIVVLHGGTICCESENETIRFVVCLPGVG